jgi:hypothetical protein
MPWRMRQKVASRPNWNSGVDIDVERLNSYRGQLGAYQRRASASHGLLALTAMAEVIAA